MTKVLGTENPADLTTKHLARESVNVYSSALGYKYRGGRSATTVKLHQVESKKVEVVRKERPEAHQWHCVGDGHWRCQVRGARALRSPSVAGIARSEVEVRITIELPSRHVIDEVYPRPDGFTEIAVCGRLGGSRDIQTDVCLSGRQPAARSVRSAETRTLRSAVLAPASADEYWQGMRGSSLVARRCSEGLSREGLDPEEHSPCGSPNLGAAANSGGPRCVGLGQRPRQLHYAACLQTRSHPRYRPGRVQGSAIILMTMRMCTRSSTVGTPIGRLPLEPTHRVQERLPYTTIL